MLGIRQKLSLGFGALLFIIAAIGVQSLVLLMELGETTDAMLRENYTSVIAAHEMKGSLQRMDSGALLTLLGYEWKGKELVLSSASWFERALQLECDSIEIPGEAEKAALLQKLFAQYKVDLELVTDASRPHDVRRLAYFNRLFPMFQEIEQAADDLLNLTQQYMNLANERARDRARAARHRMYVLLLAGSAIAVGFVVLTGKWIIRPITGLKVSAEEIAKGNLDLVIPKDSSDELGLLTESFNTMAESLREFRRSDQERLVRIERATQQAFNNLPEAIAVVGPRGEVEIATKTAASVFGLKPASSILDPLTGLLDKCLSSGSVSAPQGDQAIIQKFVDGEERYYRPAAIPILDQGGNVSGVVLILSDMTSEIEQDELKRSVIATVSHQLKTPLTSVRMTIYLLLEEKIGSLNDKQVDLLGAAREDADRLYSILEELLDISRLESVKRAAEQYPAVASEMLMLAAVDPFRRAAQDNGVLLTVDIPDHIPNVRADSMEVDHVFANLLANALKYTPEGGAVSVSARDEQDHVWFSVSDSGIGIPPEYQDKVFEQFFRVPGQAPTTGAGLGLAIAKKIVEAHRGIIRVRGREEGGSVFEFTLPKADHS